MKERFILIVLLCLTILTGCSGEKAAKLEREDVNSPEIVASKNNYDADSQKKAASEIIWDSYAEKWGDSVQLGSLPIEPDLYQLYLEGMRHKSASVRWYCAHKALEFNNIENKQEILNALNNLLNDPDENVRIAAKFTYSALSYKFDGPEFVKSPDGKNVAFYNYQDTRYNDGKLWLYNGEYKEIWLLKNITGSLGSINWSPDGKLICVTYGGRTWSDALTIDTNTLESFGDGLFQYISKNKSALGYKIGKNDRSDPMLSFLEWSPDSKRELLSYSFYDDNGSTQSGVAVYNIQKHKFEKIIPNNPSDDDHPQAQKPKDFDWSKI